MAGSYRLVWNGDRFQAGVRQRVADVALQDIAIALEAQAKQNVSTPGPPRSDPGEFPHLETGDLLAKMWVAVDFRDLAVQLGNDSDHAMPLELGTVNMAPRPYLRPTLLQIRTRAANAMRRALPSVKGRFEVRVRTGP